MEGSGVALGMGHGAWGMFLMKEVFTLQHRPYLDLQIA